MPLSSHETAILRYLGKHKTATTGHAARDLKMDRADTHGILKRLADNGLVSVDHGTLPPSWSITDNGRLFLAAAANERDSR